MGREASGNAYESRGHWYARVSLGPNAPKFAIPLPTCPDKAAAHVRLGVLVALAKKLRDAREHVAFPAAVTFLKGAGAADEKDLQRKIRTIELACAGKVPRLVDPSKALTIQKLGERWTSGELARDYPDHIKPRKRAKDDAAILARHVYSVLPDLPVASFTLDHGEEIMRGLPPALSATSRRNVALLVHKLVAMAVFPLRLLAANPLPRGWLPKAGPQKAKGWIYPDEDRALLAHTAIPLCWRVLYGFLAREGLRFSEAARLEVVDLDLDRGALNLDKNKTDDPRAWALDPGVVRALRVWLALRGVKAGTSAALFVDEKGQRLRDDESEWGKRAGGHHAARFREHLLLAGVARAALHERTAERMRVRLHDLRATFITIALANGKSETWVADRTGHRSSIMINRYRRAARTAGELGLGELTPLDAAIPEFAAVKPAGPVGGASKVRRKVRRSPGRGRRRGVLTRRLASRNASFQSLAEAHRNRTCPRQRSCPAPILKTGGGTSRPRASAPLLPGRARKASPA